ncbi:substrate-binding domain-containing protein [Sphingomonas sp. BN140010]|uniref:Substrate-binding domain-containing protein n=1 Tax=Sphingomonas arvum TaxID=2992113 RepID=A0ABT3JBM1_9SPHN|nr:substrate-binding domain-containing protein [Sphingomonas sp. BN140010]MCW3796439.1 substrate-binding domain-containing protein [Sphingomonas sp. BN140010]
MKKFSFAVLPMAALLSACGGGGGNAGAASQLKIVGSSTVYPFTTAIAEAFQKANPGSSAIVESTGTGAGIKLFCDGVGQNFPDMVNASRAMKRSEYDSCAKAGARQVIEVPIGIDGLTMIEANAAAPLKLTVADIYKALAANPFGQGPNKAQTWKDVNPALPAVKIRVLGPPPTSGTRDSLADLILTKGCESNPAMVALKKSDEAKHKDVCTKIREDGAYVEAGENDNLLVQKVAADPGTVGVLGYSFLEQNADKVRPVELGGVLPTEQTIQNLSYPGARKLYVYVKGEHAAAKPGIKQFIAEYAKNWSTGGLLEKRGLVPFGGGEAQAAAAQATALKPVDPATLK